MNRLNLRLTTGFLALLLAAFFLNATGVSAAHPEPPKTDARFAILIDAYAGKVFYEKNADSKAYPASTTKILTLITALENSGRKDIVTVSANAAGAEGSSCYLRADEEYFLADIYYAMMLESGNDAAIAIAEHIGGSVKGFVQMMNRTAQDIGAYNSHFNNPSGLPDPDHYTTARDMAMIARYAIRHPAFAEIVATDKKAWPRKNRDQPLVLKNTNELLRSYFGANGIKTGSTRSAKHCLVASAKRNGLQLIAVLFYSEPFCWNDAQKLLDYGFSLITPKVVYKKGAPVKAVYVYKGESAAELVAQEDVVLPVVGDYDKYTLEIKAESMLFAPVNVSQHAGTLRILYDGEEIKAIPLFTKAEVGVQNAPLGND
ncbi:MAG: D-alanyl-D-alanine carboxypeptidase [Acidaminococcales bacterium]|jgi:D-alanyl-D-alanine carboxypeptidase (penicillin-binding protein 5/6)|nr:D-alanyl-D-alanine carboxypeptidase [Acidaminococcales bacterium]